MSDSNTNVNATVTLTDKSPDPVNYKGAKIVYMKITDLYVDVNLNIRNRIGSEVWGVTVTRDSYDLPSMKQGIADRGGIVRPIVVSERKLADNTLQNAVLEGNRRSLAGQEMYDDPTTPKEIREALERVPVIVLKGLTPEQEREKVMDQDNKDFMRNELVRYIFSLVRQGWSFERIALNNWEGLAKLTGSIKKKAEIREIIDPALKRDKIKTWLRGTLDNYIIWGYNLGEWMRKQIIRSEMALDGQLDPNAEKPYFLTTKNSQKRVAELKKAKEADGSKFCGTMLMDGSEFKKVADKFHQEDYGIVVIDPNAPPSEKMMTRKEIEGIADSFQSKAVKAIIGRILGKNVQDVNVRDDYAAMCETKEMLVERFLPRLKPEVAAVVRLCLVNPDPTDFQKFLEANCVAE